MAVFDGCNVVEVPPEANRTVTLDADAEGLSDALFDDAITGRAVLNLAPGQTVTLSTKTLVGRTNLNSLSDLPSR